MNNSSSQQASSSSSSAAAAAQSEEEAAAATAGGIIPFPDPRRPPPPPPPAIGSSSSELAADHQAAHDDAAAAADDDEKKDAALSPPRCEWEFRLAATVPTTALPGASDAIGSLDFDPSGRFLATGGIARKIRLYDLSSMLDNPAAAAAGPAACICVPAKLSSVRWRPPIAAGASPAVVGCGDYDGVVTEYDVERGVAAWERDEHAGRRVWSLDYSPTSSSATTTMAASGSDDRTAHVWDPRSPAAGWATARAGGAVLCVEFDPSGGPRLAVGSADRRAVVYDVRALGRGAVATMDGHARAVTYVRWAGGTEGRRRRVVTSAADGTHRLWELPEEEVPAREVRSYSGHASARSFVGMGVWRGPGLVASGSESNHVFVYDLRWAKPIWVQQFSGGAHEPPQVDAGGGFVSAVAWRQGSHNDDGGGVLVAGSSDGALKVFKCRRRWPGMTAPWDPPSTTSDCDEALS